nr:MAG: hypothetical protein CM15mV140_160 [Caudoviricetes sp.]
MAVHHGKEG